MLSLLAPLTAASAADLAPAPPRIEAALERLDVTAAQRQDIRDQLADAHAALSGLREEAVALRERIHGALFGAEVDRETLESLRVELVDLVDRGTAEVFSVAADVCEVLSPAQRQELHALADERAADRRARWLSSVGR